MMPSVGLWFWREPLPEQESCSCSSRDGAALLTLAPSPPPPSGELTAVCGCWLCAVWLQVHVLSSPGRHSRCRHRNT